jgi:hypothetical protein
VFVKDVEQRTRWSFASGEPATVQIEYEVIAPVADLALLVRLYLSRDELEGQSIQIICDIWADISHQRLEAGKHCISEVTISELRLLPNRISLYLQLGSVDNRQAYDVVDANVDLPQLTITSEETKMRSGGVVPLDYAITTKTSDARHLASETV